MRHSLHLFLLAIAILTLATADLFSQDSQFSQFIANPHYLNPALTGSHSGSYRLIANYRNQWSGPLERPFTTFSAGGDVKYNLKNAGSYSAGNDIVAVGIQLYSDRVALLDYNTTQLSLLGAFHKMLSKSNNQYLSVGVQLGLAQRGINYQNLTFQDQFNGVDLYNQPTREILPANSVVSPDMSLGLHYSITPNKNNGYYIGIAYHHWNQPNISFFDLDNVTTDEYLPFALPAKLTAHISTSFAMSSFSAVEPRAVFISQGPAKSVVLGSNLRYELSETDGIDTHFGLWVRTSKALTIWEPTDVILSAGFGKGGLLIGISYDLSLAKYSANSFGTNTVEFSISYTGEHDNDSRICPSF
jgi:type IX secretion system PorP/SprF family membrane protein